MNNFRETYQELMNEGWKDNLNPLNWRRDTQHLALGLAGMVPYVGILGDITNAIMYYNDNDKYGYWISVISMIPAGDIVKVLMPFRQTTGVITNPGAVRVILYFLKKGKTALSFALRKLMKGLLKAPKVRNLIIKVHPKFIKNGVIDDVAIKAWADAGSDEFLKWCNSKIEDPTQPKKIKGQRRKPLPVRDPNLAARKLSSFATGVEKMANPRMMNSKWGLAAHAADRIGMAKYGTWARGPFADEETAAAAAAIQAKEQEKNDPNVFPKWDDDY